MTGSKTCETPLAAIVGGARWQQMVGGAPETGNVGARAGATRTLATPGADAEETDGRMRATGDS